MHDIFIEDGTLGLAHSVTRWNRGDPRMVRVSSDTFAVLSTASSSLYGQLFEAGPGLGSGPERFLHPSTRSYDVAADDDSVVVALRSNRRNLEMLPLGLDLAALGPAQVGGGIDARPSIARLREDNFAVGLRRNDDPDGVSLWVMDGGTTPVFLRGHDFPDGEVREVAVAPIENGLGLSAVTVERTLSSRSRVSVFDSVADGVAPPVDPSLAYLVGSSPGDRTSEVAITRLAGGPSWGHYVTAGVDGAGNLQLELYRVGEP